MLFNYSQDVLYALVADAFDLAEVFLDFPQVDGLAVILKQSVCLAQQEGLQFLTRHFLYCSVGVLVDYLLFRHRFTSFIFIAENALHEQDVLR